MIYTSLNPKKALVWRIVHRDNLPWILENGLFAGNASQRSPAWVSIGNAELTERRGHHKVLRSPHGVLNDYVPFYFTPFSPMLRNIHSGWGGITKRTNDEILILVSSIHRLEALGLAYVFTDSHAYYQWANFYNDKSDLDKIDWPLLQTRDFKRDVNDPGKFERYQAEVLVHQHCPIEGLVGIITYNDAVKTSVQTQVTAKGLALQVEARPGWYF
ncbi:type II toxin-antitoxin system toxin DNA ADP-ribosyl transferase DarT [Thalassolituus oleivorans]|uniref:type II toxin-antitoxin system toxin DNA ADP-ribosyl transferase DarT n=1 Tax=Thalassolituus oleivorans TaxID=187493 RepID=UPI0023F1AE45|nr:DUF4433 domain-containing protein [Thalassolituus oleivorans]